MEVIAEETLGFIGVFILFFLIWCAIVYGVAYSRKKKALAPLKARPLPWRIENDNDLFALTMKFGGSTSFKKERYKSMRTLIETGESLYFIAGLATIHVHGVNEPAGDPVIGDLFLSDRRVLLRYGPTDEVVSFPLRDIVSIALNEKAIAFCTEKTNVSFTPIITAPTAQAIYDIFDQALQAAGVVLSDAVTATVGGESAPQSQPQPQIAVDCPGCGAAVRVTVGQTAQCDFCGRLVSAAD